MPLSSQLFSGDPQLEAAAVKDSAHIVLGARGKHVEKVQTALNILDNAGLKVDGGYGPASAAAVLNYKRSRKIINYAYQTAPDNIVGKMTIARLDEEMRDYELVPPAKIQLIPVAPLANFEKSHPIINFKITETNAIVAAAIAPVLPTQTITIDMGSTAELDVVNGSGYQLTSTSASNLRGDTAVMYPPGKNDPVVNCQLTGVGPEALRFRIRGVKWGSAILWAQNFKLGETFTERMVIVVRDLRPISYHPTVAHHHEPVQEPGEWDKVCEEALKDSKLDYSLQAFAKIKASPPVIAEAAKMALFADSVAKWHYDYYLKGYGGVVNEDANLENWIKGDARARRNIATEIIRHKFSQSVVKDYFEFGQDMYDDGDAKRTFGTIDQLDYIADFNQGTVDLWFEDTYEWHPPYSQYTNPAPCKGVKDRGTHFGHAALVQMKRRGAKDFQMRGKASFR
jgi:hypothetical protein